MPSSKVITAPINLAQLVTRHQILPQIGVGVPHGLLPCSLTCPLCRQDKLTLYQDTTNNCEWGCCEGCRWAGDLIELAAAVWRQPVDETLRRLGLARVLTVPPSSCQREGYLSNYVEHRKRVAAFWEKAKASLLGSGSEVRQLAQKLNLGLDCGPELWKQRGGAFVGAATREDIHKLLNSGSTGEGILWGNFRWEEALVIAIQALPGHISGALFAYPAKPLVCRTFFRNGEVRNDIPPYQPGIAAFPAITGSAVTSDHSLFVMLDPLAALRLHAKHYANKSTTLPVVGLFPRTRPMPHLRTHCPGRELVYWAVAPSAELFAHAIATGGRISLDPKTVKNTQLRDQAPEMWLSGVKERAKPWQAALEEHLLSQTLPETESFLAALALPQYQLSAFIVDCSKTIRDKITKTSYSQSSHKRAVIYNRPVIETDRGWLLEKTGESVCDTLIKVDQIIHHRGKVRGGDYYSGRLIRSGEELPFTLPRIKFEQRGFQLLNDMLLSSGRRMLSYSPNWQKWIHALVFSFCSPATVAGIAKYGWDEQRAAFVFPSFLIKTDGDIESHSWAQVLSTRVPATNLRQPEDFELSDIQRLQEPEAPRMLAVAAAIAYAIMADACCYQAKGFGLVGEGLGALSNYAEAMGCPTRKVNKRGHQRPIDIKNNGWPLLVRNSAGVSRGLPAWLAKSRHALIEMDWTTSRVCHANGKWLILESDDENQPTLEELATAAKLIPSFLQHRMQRRLNHVAVGKTAFDQILIDMDEWLVAKGLPPGTVDCSGVRARISYDTKEASAISFIELICRSYDEAKMTGFVPPKTEQPQKLSVKPKLIQRPQLIHLPDHGGSVWIPKANLYHVFGECSPLVDTAAVSRALASAGLLLGECDYNHAPGWVISKAVWDKHMALWRRQNQATLRLA